jgi:hypothetical protein
MNSAWIGLPSFLMGGATTCIGWYFWREGRDLRSTGVDAQATLVRKFRKEGDTFLFGIENRFVTAAFTDGQGRPWTVDIRVPSRQWDWLREGSKASIIYMQSNPQRARVISRLGQKILGGFLLYMTVSSALMALFGLYFVFGGSVDLKTMPKLQSISVSAPLPAKFDKNGWNPAFRTSATSR